MEFVLQPWHLLLTILAGLINRQQQQVIAYLRTKNQVLKEAHGKRRIRLNDDQRRRLAVKGKVLGRRVLSEIGTSFTPDTILRWHRQLVAEKWDYSDRRKAVGRPRVRPEIVDLVLRIARENPSWGYVRLQGALANLGHKLSDTTVGNILREHGIEPAPERKRQSTCREFLEAHWDVLMDRDTKFSAAFRSILASAGVRAVRLPARSPNLNSHLERFMRSLNGECLERMIFFGERSLRTATVAFLAHYHGERNHQGLDNRLIEEDEQVGLATGQVQCRERLGGMLRCYYRAAA
jgi:transposase InsO family protein